MVNSPWALVVLNMGGPDSLRAVRPFLRNLLADPALVQLPFPLKFVQRPFAWIAARRRAALVGDAYRMIGGGTPLLRWSTLQAQKAARRAGERGVVCHPIVAMRYWKPRADEAAAAVKTLVEHAGVKGVVVLTLYPQYSDATTGSSFEDFRASLRRAGLGGLPRVEIDRYPTLEGYVEATAESVRRALPAAGPSPFVLFSAHGLPEAYVERGDPYREEIEATYRAVVARLPAGLDLALSFQSRVGPRRWLQPYTDAFIEDLAGRGVKNLLMVPLAFVSDHIETTYEMDVLYGDLARARGMAFSRVPALNDDDRFCAALGDLVVDRISALPSP